LQHKPEYLLSLLLLAGLMLAGCAQKDSSVGSNLAPGLSEALPQEMFLPPQDVRFYRTSVTTGASTLLYLGFDQGYYANTLLKFNPIGSLPDSFLVDSLKVKLVVDSVMIPGTGAMTSSAFLVNYQQPWNEIGTTWDNFNTDSLQLGSSFATLEIPPAAVDSDSVVFTLPAPDSLIRSWASAGSGGKTLQFNNGIYLAAATSQDYLLRFASAEYPTTSHRPKLQMFLQDYDTAVTHGGDPVDTVLYVNAVADAFIAHDSTALTPADSAFIWLGNGAAYRTLMRFNIDSAFTAHYGMAVQRAELILRSDTANALAFDHVNGAYGLPMADTTWLQNPADGATLPVSLPTVSPYVTTTGILSLNVTNLVNDWVIHPGTHHGLMVHSANEYFSVARLPFWGWNAPADSLKPVLRIVYVQGGGGQ
jgi:hypothetical protein